MPTMPTSSSNCCPGREIGTGLPDSIRFWKTRIEETDADNTFSVGLIYGPSGCGKSSLVKAGLLPRLSDDVIAVYVEATAEETEARLLNGLRKRCPALPDNLGLKETLAALRRGQGIPVGQEGADRPRPVRAMAARQEGRREHGTGASPAAVRRRPGAVHRHGAGRFLAGGDPVHAGVGDSTCRRPELGAVDLFDSPRPRRCWRHLGGPSANLPENPSDTSKDQKEFLEQAVSGLAQEGKVICVRLALFAEMMKGKAWTPATLKAVGGTEGVGVTFLEETFSAATAPPEHRYHQKAARAVLKALLPETGTDIKGHMRSYAELLEASGYGSRPKDFDDLIRILDSEIRLITPTDPEGKEADGDSVSRPSRGRNTTN